MSNVVGIKGQPALMAAKPNKEVIDMLKSVLEMAESGQCQLAAVAWVESDGTAMDAYAPGGSICAEIMPLSREEDSLIGWIEAVAKGARRQ